MWQLRDISTWILNTARWLRERVLTRNAFLASTSLVCRALSSKMWWLEWSFRACQADGAWKTAITVTPHFKCQAISICGSWDGVRLHVACGAGHKHIRSEGHVKSHLYLYTQQYHIHSWCRIDASKLSCPTVGIRTFTLEVQVCRILRRKTENGNRYYDIRLDTGTGKSILIVIL